jgi:hypothetical protein
LTLTSPDATGLTMRELYCSWDRLRAALRKSGELREYLAVVELTEQGAPHLHVIATGKYIEQRRLAGLAERAGFGRVADIRAVRGTGSRSATGYMVKSLARYATKSSVELLAAKAARESIGKRRQVRPVRMSRRWYPGGLGAAERAVVAEANSDQERDADPGPWFLVQRREDGSVAVLSRPKLVSEQAPPGVAERRAA